MTKIQETLDQIREICEDTPRPKESDSNDAFACDASIDEILDLVKL